MRGSWRSSEFFTVLAKFGVQKTDNVKLEQTRGFIYGNVTLVSPPSNLSFTEENQLYLVLTDHQFFTNLYGNRYQWTENACNEMMKEIRDVAFHSRCCSTGGQDFLRRVPCESQKLCSDEDKPQNVIADYQFTFRVQDKIEPRFWYLTLISCSLNQTCHWIPQTADLELNYDIWLVNGAPTARYANPFEHQFSFDQQDCAEIYFAALLVFAIVFGIQLHAIRRLYTH